MSQFRLAAAALLALFPLAAFALENRLHETFDTQDLCDTGATTAWWDTEAGELKLPAFATDNVGQWDSPGTVYGVASQGPLVYLADGAAGLQIVDVSDPTSPALLGVADTPGSAWGVVVDGSVAYVADYTGFLQVVDVTDPAAPTVIASATADQPLMRVAVAGDRLFAAARSAGLLVYDVSDPASPTLLGQGDTPGTSFGVALAGDVAYVADGEWGLQVVDISDPTAPVVLGGMDSASVVYGADVAGDLVCLADLGLGLVTVDVSDPANPVQLGAVALPATGWNVHLDGGLAQVSCATGGVVVVDVSDPAAPEIIDTVDTPGSARDTAAWGRFLLTADYNLGLQVLRARVPRDVPAEAAQLTMTGTASGLAADGALVAVADGAAGLQLVDAARVDQPQLLATLGDGLDAVGVALDGDRACVLDSGQGLKLVDVTDPSSPVLLGACQSGSDPTDLLPAGDVVYVADAAAGLVSVDIADPTSPSVVGSVATAGTARALDSVGDLACVAVGAAGLAVVSIRDPALPVVLATLALPGDCRDVQLDGDRALVAAGAGGLHLVDLSDPAAPALITSLSLPGEALQLASSGGMLMVAGGTGGLHLVDVADPGAPQLLGSFTLPGDTCRQVVLQGDHALTTFDAAGLVITEVFTRTFQTDLDMARSEALSDPDHDVLRARLTTAQADSFRWDVTALEGDTSYVEIRPDSTWQRLEAGRHLTWQAHLVAAEAGPGPVCQELTLEWLYDTAVIDSVEDAPDDQGGAVNVHFTRSGLDFGDEEDTPVTSYSVWRLLAPGAAGLPTDPPPGQWEQVATVAATQADHYTASVTTAQDSLVSVYRVFTFTSEPTVWFYSPADSAASYDDLAPAQPTGLDLQTPELLVWDEPVDDDFDHFTVYGAAVPELDGAVNLGEPQEPQLAVTPDAHDYYLVTATDLVGNESEPAVLAVNPDAVDDGPPGRTWLQPTAPNPFNPRTTMAFTVPAQGPVRLQIMDLAGRLVATLVDRPLPAGRHEAVWDGRDASGRAMPSGVYLSRLEAGGQVARGRMTLVR